MKVHCSAKTVNWLIDLCLNNYFMTWALNHIAKDLVYDKCKWFTCLTFFSVGDFLRDKNKSLKKKETDGDYSLSVTSRQRL